MRRTTMILATLCAACVTTPRPQPPTLPVPVPRALDVSGARAILDSARQEAESQAHRQAMIPVVARAQVARAQATASTRERVGVAWRVLPDPGDWRKILERWKAREGSLSLGSASRGTLQEAAELTRRGAHHQIIARAWPRNTRYATRRLRDGLLDAAKEVATAYPGPRLAVGNLSYKNGGDIRWSVSHNSGRDADLAFYVLEASTRKAVTAPDLIVFGDDGVSPDGKYLFDVERNWALVRALLNHKELQMQYLFVSLGLKAMLLEHAQKLGEPEALIEKARGVLHQPTDSSPHNDHLHVRVTCGLRERLLGCLDRGPRWAWVNWFEQELLANAVAVSRAMQSPRVEDRVAALTYLREIRSPYAADVALWLGMRDASPEVRALSTSVAGAYWSWTLSALDGATRAITAQQTTPKQRASLYAILRRSVHPSVVTFLKERVVRGEARERALATRALTHHMLHEHVPFLLERLRQEAAPDVRVALSRVLRRITNHAQPIDWLKASQAQRASALEKWDQWWSAHAEMPRDVWVARGFGDLGVEEENAFKPVAVDALIAALPQAPDHQVYNINKTLRRVTGRWVSLEKSDGKKLHAFWTRWWKKNRARFLSVG